MTDQEQKIIDRIDYWKQLYEASTDHSGTQELALRLMRKWEKQLEDLRRRPGEGGN